MKTLLLVPLLAAPAFAGTAAAAAPTACALVTASEYQRVLQVPVNLIPSAGGEVCKVSIRGSQGLLTSVFPYSAQVFANTMALKSSRGARVTRVSVLGPQGYYLRGGDPRWTKTTLAIRHGSIVSFQAGAGTTRAQVIALTKLALARV